LNQPYNSATAMPSPTLSIDMALARCTIDSLRSAVRHLSDRNLVELVALVTGHKNTVRLVMDTADWVVLRETLPTFNLLGQHAEFKLGVTKKSSVGDQFTTDRPWDDETAESILVYVAHDQATIDDALQKERSKSNDNGVGELLGYPSCCITAYREIVQGKLWVNQIVTQTAGSLTSCYTNKLAYLFKGSPSFLPDYYPCSLSCAGSARLGKTFFEAMLAFGMRELAESMKQKLLRPILYMPGLLIQLKQISRQADRITFEPQDADFYHFGFSEGQQLLAKGQLPISQDENGVFGTYNGITYRLLQFTDLY